MPRVARLDVPGLLQHVIVRGVESFENRSPLGKIGIKESVALLNRSGRYYSVLITQKMALRGSEWVKLYLFEHTSQNLEPEIFFITKTVSLSLNDADLIIQPLHKT